MAKELARVLDRLATGLLGGPGGADNLERYVVVNNAKEDVGYDREHGDDPGDMRLNATL